MGDHIIEYTMVGEVDSGKMPTFAPTTYDVPKHPEVDGNHDRRYSLWRYFSDGVPTSYTVIITSGSANASPGYQNASVDQLNAADSGSGEHGAAIFEGGQTYTVTSGEDTILTAAGYTVT